MELRTVTVGTADWLRASQGLKLSAYVEPHAGTLGSIGTFIPQPSPATIGHEDKAYISAQDYPALAEIWDNEEDDVFDTL